MAESDTLMVKLLLSPKEHMCIETYPEIMEKVQQMVWILEAVYEAGLGKSTTYLDNDLGTDLGADLGANFLAANTKTT